MLRKIVIATIILTAFQTIGAQKKLHLNDILDAYSELMTMSAPKKLHINDIFDAYGKRQGSALIELARDVLGNRTNISRYKSLTVTVDNGMADSCLQAIQNDTAEGSVILEKKQGGKIETASYCLHRSDNAEYEYILFNIKARKMTLIYIRGTFPPQQLEKEIDRLKDLFIKVNDKQIKL